MIWCEIWMEVHLSSHQREMARTSEENHCLFSMEMILEPNK